MKITNESEGFPVSELTDLGGNPEDPEGSTPSPDCCEDDPDPIDRAADTGFTYIFQRTVLGDGHLVQSSSDTGTSTLDAVMAGDVTPGNTLVVLLTQRSTFEPTDVDILALGYQRINDPFYSSPGHNGGASSLWTKIADAGDGDTLHLTFTSAQSRRVAWAEFDGSLVVDDSAWVSDESNGTTEDVGPLTVTGTTLLVVGWDTSKQTGSYTVTLGDSFTEIDNGTVPGSATQPMHVLGYKLVAAGTYDSSITTSGTTNGRGAVLAAFVVPPEDGDWVAGGDEAVDGDDATCADGLIGPELMQVDLGGPGYKITNTRIVIEFDTAGAQTLTINAANEGDFSDSVLIATIPVTAVGSFTAQTVSASWLGVEYQFWELTGTDDEEVNICTWELIETTTTAVHDHTLDELSDVDTSGVSDGDVLIYDDTTDSWVAGTPISDHGALTGLLDDDHTQYVLKTLGGKEVVNTVAASGTTETLNLASGNVHDVTLSADCTFTFTGATSGVACGFTLVLRQPPSGGPRLATWPGSVGWLGGSAPTLSTGADEVDVLTFLTLDGGTNWIGSAGGGGGGSGTPATTVEAETTFGISSAVGTDTEYARQDHTHGTPANPFTGAAAGGDLSGTYPNPSVVDDSHSHTSATAPGGSGGGQILITDTPAGSPLVFADLLQNEAGTDLLYSDA